jgi:hypothetical protein
MTFFCLTTVFVNKTCERELCESRSKWVLCDLYSNSDMSNPNTRLGTLLYTAPYFQRVGYRLATGVGYVQIAGAIFFLPKFMDGTYKFPGIPQFESHENRKVVSIGVMSLLLFSNLFWFRVSCKLPERCEFILLFIHQFHVLMPSVYMNAPMKALIIYPIALPPVPRVRLLLLLRFIIYFEFALIIV